jgi:signal transduction histidine kinase
MNYINKISVITVLFLTVATSIFAINTSFANTIFFNTKTVNNTSEELTNIKKLLADGDTKKALEALYVFIEKVVRNNEISQIIESKILLADILRDNGDYIKSNEIFNEVLPLIKSNPEKLQYVYFKKGGNFQLDSEIDSAEINYEKAIFYAEEIEGNEDLRAKMHANLSGINYLNEDYEKSIEHSKIARNYQKKLGNIEIEAGILNNLGTIYYMQGNFKEALATFEEAFNLVGYGQSELQKKTRSTSFINMAYAYSGMGNFEKAFEFQDKYFSLNDSLQQELKYKEIAEIESKYQVATKEKEAAIEKTKRQEAEVLTYGLGIAILILLSGIYALYNLIKLNRKNHALQISQEQLLNQNKLDKIKSESQSKILVATMDGRIQERKNISDILHGSVSAMLSAANLHLYASEIKFNGNVPDEIVKTQAIISEASVQVRKLSHTLISAILLKQGLGDAIKDICEKSSNATIQLKCESKNIERFNNDFEIKIFNIIQELVINMLKHSKAESGTVKLEQLNGALQILVFDNGKGFNVAEENVDAGIGLSQIKARIENLKGILQISSSNKGTRIFISVPIVY